MYTFKFCSFHPRFSLHFGKSDTVSQFIFLFYSVDICSLIVDGMALEVLFLRFLASAELELTGFLTVKLVSLSTLISLRAWDISCWTSGQASLSSFKTWEVKRGVWGTAVNCCKKRKKRHSFITLTFKRKHF